MVSTTLLLAFFISGVVNHSMAFASLAPQQHTQLWHCFNLICGLVSMVAVLAKHELGYWWLMTVFLWQIPLEFVGAYMTIREGTRVASQIIEPFLNAIALLCLLGAKSRYLAHRELSIH